MSGGLPKDAGRILDSVFGFSTAEGAQEADYPDATGPGFETEQQRTERQLDEAFGLRDALAESRSARWAEFERIAHEAILGGGER